MASSTLAARCLGFAALLALLGAVSHESHSAWAALAVAGAVLCVTWDRPHPMSLRNFFLLYTVGLFAVGSALLDITPRPYGDMVLYIGAFLCGYVLVSVKRPDATPVAASRRRQQFVVGADRIHVLEVTIVVLVGLNGAVLLYNVMQYGVGAFYGGQALIDQFATYGKASVSAGVLQIAVFFIKYTGVAAVVLYACTCLEQGVKIRYRYPLALLVGVPIALLARSDALTGAGFLLVVLAVDRRITARRGRIGLENRPRPVARRGVSTQPLAIAMALAIAFTAAILIGGLRTKAAPSAAPKSSFERNITLLKSELTPIQAYSEIRANEDTLGHPHGSTIIAPLILKIVPRALFPAKPQNSGAYYLSRIRPQEFAASYALPPTFYGDGFLSFGIEGAVVLCLLLGVVAARLDVAYKEAALAKLPMFLVVYANFFALLRNALSESLAGILLTLLALTVLRHLLGSRVGPAQPAPRRRLRPAVTTASR